MNEIIFLGTSSMAPTKERNQPSVIIRHGGEIHMLDCGEGTQKQMKHAKISPAKIKNIYISHWHGDHVIGLPGLLQTLAANEYTGRLSIFGPEGTKTKFALLMEIFPFENTVETIVSDIKTGIIFETSDYLIHAKELRHSIKCFGYSFTEKDKVRVSTEKLKKLGLKDGPYLKDVIAGKSVKVGGKSISQNDICTIKKGKKVTYITDTALCDEAIQLAENSDVLICESTYGRIFGEKAEKRLHLTSLDAARIALESNSKKLILFHFSQRYESVSELEEEAREIFPNAISAYDFMKVKL
jgi:ribonuclease Z